MNESLARFRADLEKVAQALPERVGVAVSGGPDSLALLLLAADALPNRVLAATVDHGLRPESAAEAEFVASLCAGRGVPHAVLGADMTPGPNLHAVARARRYALLDGWALENRLDCVLTAHHLDDQAETLVMRLLRGAGVGGLAGIRARKEDGRIAVLRPLLAWRRAELLDVVRIAGIEPVRDPSNLDERFDRARIRRHLADTDWLDPEPLARSAAALAEAEAALDWATERLFEERFDGTAFDPTGIPAELRRRLVLGILRASGGPAPRGEQVTRLLAQLERGGTGTLAGVKCAGGTLWRFAPAPPRR